MSRRSPWMTALEVLGWVVLTVVATGASVIIALLVSIDCNGIWNDRPDQTCTDRKSWMALLPVIGLFALIWLRVALERRRLHPRSGSGPDRDA